MLFRKLFILASLCASSFGSTFSEVHQSTTALVGKAQKVDDAIAALSPTPGIASISQLKAVKVAADELAVAVDQTTQGILAVSPSPVSENDGQVTLDILRKILPIVKAALAKLNERKGSLASLASVPLFGRPSLSFMKSHIVALVKSINSLEDAYESSAPASLSGEAKLLRGQFNSLFQQGIAVFDDVMTSA